MVAGRLLRHTSQLQHCRDITIPISMGDTLRHSSRQLCGRPLSLRSYCCSPRISSMTHYFSSTRGRSSHTLRIAIEAGDTQFERLNAGASRQAAAETRLAAANSGARAVTSGRQGARTLALSFDSRHFDMRAGRRLRSMPSSTRSLILI